MCQCLPCECWWCNCCGTCAGFAYLYCCCGFWCCKNDEMKRVSDACCYCCESSGYGGNFFCYGCVCCAPTWLQTYSKVASGKMPPQQQFGGQQQIIVQQPYGQQQYGGQQQFAQQGQPQVTYAGGATIVRV